MIIEIMCDTTRQLADRLHLVRTLNLLCHTLALRLFTARLLHFDLQAYQASTSLHSGQQNTWGDRLGNIIIGAGFKGLNQ